MEKTRYWLKIDRDFLGSKAVKIINNRNPKLVLFYMSLMLESIPTIGHLRLSEKTPYDSELLSEAFDVDLDIATSGLELFQSLGLVEILEDGTIFMAQVPNMTGKECDSAERVRNYRNSKKISTEITSSNEQCNKKDEDINFNSLQCNTNVTKCNDNINKQSKYTTKEYIKYINKVDNKLINRINSSCSCCVEKNELALQIIFNWVQIFKNEISDIVERAIEIMSLKNDVKNKLFFINGILKNWFLSGQKTIRDIDMHINYSTDEIGKEDLSISSEIEELLDYDWIGDVTNDR